MQDWFYSSVLYRIWRRFLTWFGDLYFATEPPSVKGIDLRKVMSLVKKVTFFVESTTIMLTLTSSKGHIAIQVYVNLMK